MVNYEVSNDFTGNIGRLCKILKTPRLDATEYPVFDTFGGSRKTFKLLGIGLVGSVFDKSASPGSVGGGRSDP